MKDSIKWRFAYIALMLALVPFAILPVSFAERLGKQIGKLLKEVLPKWNGVGIEAISGRMEYLRSHPLWTRGDIKAQEIIDQIFANTGVFLAELARLYFGMEKKLMDNVEIRGIEHYTRAHARGRGIIGITAHSGNWELMALTFGAKIHPVAVVARNMKRGYFDAVLEKIRLQHGNRVIYRDSGVKEMFLLLKGNGILGILPDQVVMPPHGILADFMGSPAWTTVMPAKLSIKTGCAMLPFFTHRENGKNIITIYPEVQFLAEGTEEERILDGTIKMNRAIGDHIVRHPTQWNWLYRRWRDTNVGKN